MPYIMKLEYSQGRSVSTPTNKTLAGHTKLRDSREDSLLMTGWLEVFANETTFIFRTLKKMKRCTFLQNTMEAQGASADSSNCLILHTLLRNQSQISRLQEMRK
jgi:hypothetical protein